MQNALKRLLDSLRQTEERRRFVMDFLAEIESARPVDHAQKDRGGGSISVGCVTFTAVHGEPVREQLSIEVDNLRSRMARGLTRARGGFWSAINQQILVSANSGLEEFISSNSEGPAGEVPPGVVRQYFYCDSGKGDVSIKALEFDERDFSGPRKRNPASTNNMVRSKSFETSGILSYLDRLAEEILKKKNDIAPKTVELLKDQPSFGHGLEKWFYSLTDTSSKGGLLAKTCQFTDYRPMYCPKCVEGLVEVMRTKGVMSCTLPPIPFTVLDVDIFCTENIHRDHSIGDCLSVVEVERMINDLRAEQGHVPHLTMVCELNDSYLEKKFGKWVWTYLA